MLTRTGHSLVEVLVAGMVLLAGVVPAAAALGHSLRWGMKGRAKARAAIVASARMEELKAKALQTSPACTSLAGGSNTAAGVSEIWTVDSVSEGRLVAVVVSVPLPGLLVSDTLTLRLACG